MELVLIWRLHWYLKRQLLKMLGLNSGGATLWPGFCLIVEIREKTAISQCKQASKSD
jgi:hypothetical protein